MQYNEELETPILPKEPFSLFPLYEPTIHDMNRVLAQADEYPAQLEEYTTDKVIPFKRLPQLTVFLPCML